MKRIVWFFACLGTAFGTAAADVVHLKGGGRVEGVVTVEGGEYVVRSFRGTARVDRDEVVRIVRTPSRLEIYEARRAALAPGDAGERFRLALWCAGKGLEREARLHLEETVRIDPDHAEARARLGYVRFRGMWMGREEARDAEMAARGFLRFEGMWFTPAGLKAWIAARGEKELLAERVAKARAEREKAEAAARREAEKLAKEAAERRALEQALARLEADRRERDRLARQNAELLDRLRDLYLRDAYLGTGWIGGGWYGPSLRGGALPGSYSRSCAHGRGGPGLVFRYHRGSLSVRGRIW